MVNMILGIALVLIILSMALAFVRFIIGPDTVDRLVSYDVMTIASIAIIGIISYSAKRIIYLDIGWYIVCLSLLGY